VTVNGFVRTIAAPPPANNALHHRGRKLGITMLWLVVQNQRKVLPPRKPPINEVLPPSKTTGIPTSASDPHCGRSNTTCCLLFCAKVDALAAGF